MEKFIIFHITEQQLSAAFSVREKIFATYVVCDTVRCLEQVQISDMVTISQRWGETGYSAGCASHIFGMFRKSLDYALQMGYVEKYFQAI